MPPKRNSAHWLPTFEAIGDALYSQYLNKDCVIFHKNNFTRVDEYCDIRVEKIKTEMYPNYIERDTCLLDAHKIASVHIQGFLKNPIYETAPNANVNTIVDKLPNEHYCFLILYTIINSWSHVKTAGKTLQIPNYYRDSLLKLFYKYRNSSIIGLDDTTFNYALSNIIYFVENKFLVPVI